MQMHWLRAKKDAIMFGPDADCVLIGVNAVAELLLEGEEIGTLFIQMTRQEVTVDGETCH